MHLPRGICGCRAGQRTPSYLSRKPATSRCSRAHPLHVPTKRGSTADPGRRPKMPGRYRYALPRDSSTERMVATLAASTSLSGEDMASNSSGVYRSLYQDLPSK